MVTADPNATRTPTPFLPLDPTATPIFTPTATPTIAPTQPEPAPVTVFTELDLPDDVPSVTNVLLLGSDERPGGGFRTDVVMLVSIHSDDRTVRVVSFPRDLYVNIPYWGMNRLNVVMNMGGFQLMSDTFAANFNIRPDYYLMTNFQGFKDIINTLDGIYVDVETELYDQCDLNWMDSHGYCLMEPGTVRMDGETALWYCRSRHSTSDFDRNRRQQEVMYALMKRVAAPDNIIKVAELYDLLKDSVETDMGVEQVIKLAPLAPALTNPERVRRYSVGPDMVWDYFTPEGAMVLYPNQVAILQMMQEAIYGP